MKEKKPRILVFASGTATGGGSGFANLVKATQSIDGHPPVLNAEIVAVVSNHPRGGVAKFASELGIQFSQWTGEPNEAGYKLYSANWKADYVILSGWLKLVKGLDSSTTINIHPGPLPKFGGPKMYGHYVHEAVIEDYYNGDIQHSAVTMHYVTEKYDEGPQFLSYPVEISPGDSPESLAARVNQYEHIVQPWATNLIVTDQITWDGKGPVRVPKWYKSLPCCPEDCKVY